MPPLRFLPFSPPPPPPLSPLRFRRLLTVFARSCSDQSCTLACIIKYSSSIQLTFESSFSELEKSIASELQLASLSLSARIRSKNSKNNFAMNADHDTGRKAREAQCNAEGRQTSHATHLIGPIGAAAAELPAAAFDAAAVDLAVVVVAVLLVRVCSFCNSHQLSQVAPRKMGSCASSTGGSDGSATDVGPTGAPCASTAPATLLRLFRGTWLRGLAMMARMMKIGKASA